MNEMKFSSRVPRILDPNDPGQMDLFNEEYSAACALLGIPREQLEVADWQAAEYLGMSIRTIHRYAYSNPPLLEKVPSKRGDGLRLTLDSVVEHKLAPRFRRYKK